ncbi:ABC transporter substrate-binding protein [Paenibacillus sp. LHD-117]|uniref:ABC transporter substrate-binding protein n=1 Tax=Paenibacillus sp. LHD-117 TaxID=3071412 RepID=UPI0027E1F0EB|nr:ABC transporter substrate-binding protein [Paenibacillus sp. LHD-117]MDQ6423600.1 ABC transporter substrate-binding protein [Paenibacillus sp. LHD-117]
MKSTRKLIVLALVMIISSFMGLSACSKKQAPEDTGNNASASAAPEETSAPEPTPEPLEPYTIKMFVPGGAAPKDQALVNEEVSKYLKDKLNVTLDMEVIEWGSWQDKINLKMASGEEFDLVSTFYWDNYLTKIQQGSIIPLNDLMDKYAKEAVSIMHPSLLNGGLVGGKTYGMPTNKEMASAAGLLFRKDLVDKYQFDLSKVKTLQDLEPIYEVIKKNESGIYPLFVNKDLNLLSKIADNLYFTDLGDGKGAVLDRTTEELKVIDKYQDPRTKEVMDLSHKWFKAGYINKDAATITDFQGPLKAGQVFSYVDLLKPGKDAEVSASLGQEWVQVIMTKPIVMTTDAQGVMLSISRTSKNPERVMQFLNLLYTDKTLINLIDFGIEGKHYVKVSDNIIDFPAGIDASTSGYNPGAAWLMGNQFNAYLWKNEDPNKYENFKVFNDTSEASKSLGFSFTTDAVKNEIGAYVNVLPEFEYGLNVGALDPNVYLPKLIDKLKTVGSDKILAEKQKQLDAWVTSK